MYTEKTSITQGQVVWLSPNTWGDKG